MDNPVRVYFNKPQEEAGFRGVFRSPPARLSEEVARLAGNPALLNHLEADLALARRDPKTGTWRLVRDFGQTPLYYALLPDGFAWSFSYVKLLDYLAFEAPALTEPDEATLFDYLATHYRHVFRDPGRTFHRGVRQVPAGAYVDIDEAGARVSSWLDLRQDPHVLALGPEEATQGLMDLLKHSVDWRAGAALGPAFTVSSGLDSSGVASLAARTLGRGLDVFSAGYTPPTEYDESAGVRELIQAHPDWRWTHLTLDRPDLFGETEKLIKLTRSPVITVTWLVYHLLAKNMEGFREVFTGLGGDESLAGEYGHFFYFFADLKAAGDTARLEDEIEGWGRLHDHPVFRKNRTEVERFWARNLDFATGEIKVDQEVYRGGAEFFNDDWFETFGRPAPPMPRPYPGFLANRLFQEISFETTPPTLWGFQRVNEALGLRGVSPFLSPPLFKFCLSLPGTVKYDRGLTKALLRRGLGGLLPESIRTLSRKTGFNAPADRWFGEARTRRLTMEILHDGPLARRGWLKKGAVERLFKEHPRVNHMMRLWPLLNASLFLEG
ncbi:MAG: asparagine synthase-related protein [Deltaproteobacteria bacterium]|nr:asparagine synthase-related protein [Deltaproteobacteria bacterium]